MSVEVSFHYFGLKVVGEPVEVRRAGMSVVFSLHWVERRIRGSISCDKSSFGYVQCLGLIAEGAKMSEDQ